MNQKGFSSTILVLFVIVFLGITIYFVFVKDSKIPDHGLKPTNPIPSVTTAPIPTSKNFLNIKYRNNQYGFEFTLPANWKGYSIVITEWDGYNPNNPQGHLTIESGPLISIRHPQYTSENPRQDIPIMVLTASQWNLLQQGKFHIGAAPINPSELGHNSIYVFALPARYNYALLTGYEEVEGILQSNPLQAF